MRSYLYNANNELTGYDNAFYVYDSNGNMIEKTVDGVVTSYVYNIEDRLTEVWNGEVSTGSLVASYYYDPFGRRLWKDVGGTKTYFLYADEGLIGEYDQSGAEIKTYGYKPGSTWTTDPLFMKEGSDYYFYQNDHLGTPQKLTATNGAVAWSATYSSFGEASVDASSTITSNLRFPGQYYDQETGLHYNWHRIYDPRTGRYLTPDPTRFRGGINLYPYVQNSPISLLDPLGLKKNKIYEVIPDPLGNLIQAAPYKREMQRRFMKAYQQGLRFCFEKANKDIKKCLRKGETPGCFSSCAREMEYRKCEMHVISELQTCVRQKEKWKHLHDKYSFLKALWDSYRLNEDEAFEKYRKKLGDNYPLE